MARRFFIIKHCVFIISLSIVIGFGFLVANATISPQPILVQINDDDYANTTYSANRFTQMDDLRVNPSRGATLRLEVTENQNYDRLVQANDIYELYFNSYLNIIKLKNKSTNYVWASALDSFDYRDIKTRAAGNILSSTVGIGYYFYNATNDTYTDASFVYLNEVTIFPDGSKPVAIAPNVKAMEVTSEWSSSDSARDIALHIRLKELKITLNVYFDLTDSGLSVFVPDAEIKEETHRLAGLYLMPAWGATREADEPGYLVIPDGSGALIRYGEAKSSSQITMKYFGNDYGLGPILVNPDLNEEKILSLPIYGFVNGIKQNAMLGVIESGAYNADLIISLAGTSNNNYNYLTTRFNIRNQYLLYGVNKTVEEERNGEDIKLSFFGLTGEDATYLGMAKRYQSYLVEEGVLQALASSNYRLNLDILLAETVPALIGTKNETLTSINELNSFIDSLTSIGVNNLSYVLKGWNKGGLSGNTPYKLSLNKSVGSSRAFTEFLEKAKDQNAQLYFYNDYVEAYSGGEASIRYDVARTIQRLKMSFTNQDAPLYQDYYYLYPNESLRMAKKDLERYADLEIPGLLIDSLGNHLFSYYHKGTIYHRYQAVQHYQNLMEEVSKQMKIALDRPNSYLWKHLSAYFNMPLYTNQYHFYTDTVPFLPYVLKGFVEYYGPSINFYANHTDQLLRLLDFGAFPSYTITGVESRALKYTNSNGLFTTKFSDWESTMVKEYQRFEQVYQMIGSARIKDREVLSPGVIQVTYQNNVKIVINYTESSYQGVPANDFRLVGEN